MRAIVVFVLTFVVGIAAASGAKIAMTKSPAAKVADSGAVAGDSATSAAKSAHTDTAIAAATTPVTPPGDTLPVAAAKKPLTFDSAASKAAPPSGATPPAIPPQSDSAVKEREGRLAKVFTSMDAKQAAKVLEHMSDGDVQIILGYVGPRQAAAILAELPPERVALISKQTIQGGKR